MRRLSIGILFFFLALGSTVKGQSFYKLPWKIGVGINTVEVSGFANTFNIMSYPSILSCERQIVAGFSIVGIGSFNQLKAGSNVGNGEIRTTKNYYAFDVLAKYNFHALFDNSRYPIRPYIIAGYGYTNMDIPKITVERSQHAETIKGFTTNDLGLGFEVCFVNITKSSTFLRPFEVGFQLMEKFTEVSADHLQNSISILYILPYGKFLTNKI